MGQYDPSHDRVLMALNILDNFGQTLETLVHEVAHRKGTDGSKEHVSEIETLWRDLFVASTVKRVLVPGQVRKVEAGVDYKDANGDAVHVTAVNRRTVIMWVYDGERGFGKGYAPTEKIVKTRDVVLFPVDEEVMS